MLRILEFCSPLEWWIAGHAGNLSTICIWHVGNYVKSLYIVADVSPTETKGQQCMYYTTDMCTQEGSPN